MSQQLATRPRSLLALSGWQLLGCAVAVGAGLVLAGVSFGPLKTCVAAFGVSVAAIETLRRKGAPNVPWWMAHVAVLPWAAVVLFPWLYFVRQGSWLIIDIPIDMELSRTWVFHLVALIGMTFGTALGLMPRLRQRSTSLTVVDWRKVSLVMSGSIGLYLMSFVVARRPFSALWRLSGDVRYYDNVDQGTALGILDYSIGVASGVLLVAAAARRTRLSRPGLVEVSWLILLSVLTLGSGARGRFYLVILGWLIVQFRPLFSLGTVVRRVALVLLGVGLILSALSVAGTISQLRARGEGVEPDPPVETAVKGLDVIGSGELLLMRGGQPSMLAGQSYEELPRLFVPRRFAGDTKGNPAADDVVRRLLDRDAGFSAPLWFEPLLNYGGSGVLVFGVAYGWLAVWLLRTSAGRLGSRFAASVAALGPVWILVSYQALSRLTLMQVLLTVGSLLGGVLLASRAVVFEEEFNPV